MKLRDILTENTKFAPDVGAVHVRIDYVPEHQEVFDRMRYKSPINDAYVVYAHTLDYTQHDTMDLLKSRKKYSSGDEAHQRDLSNVVDAAIDTVIKADPEVRYKHEGTKAAIRQLQAFMKNGKRVIVTAAPSSSTFSKLIAERLAARIGAKFVDVLEKETHPPISMKQLKRDYPDEDFSSVEDPSTFRGKMVAAQTQMERAIEADDDEQFEYWEKEFEAARKKYEAYRYKRKAYQYAHNAHIGRAFYNTIRAKPEAVQLRDAYVILVDDNVMQGVTFGEAIKTLVVQGNAPKQIIGFVPHRFVSPRG